jgi:hypothetical protein
VAVTIEPIDGISQPTSIPSDDPWKAEGAGYDWAIAGLHFNSAVSAENPMERAFSRVTKEAIDQSDQPGDQSLDGWWIRSQTDWSGGAGYEFMEPITADPIPKTFNWSYGVNPWDPGKLYLHRKPRLGITIPLAEGASPVMAVHADTAGTQYLYIAVGTAVYRFLVTSLKTTGFTVETLPSPYATLPSKVVGLTVAEGFLLASTESDGVYRVQATPFQLFKTSAIGITRIDAYWAKDRLILAAGRHLYEQPLPTALVDLDSITPLVSQPETSWRWVSVTSGPRGVLVAGRGTTSSSISLITLDADGGLPTLAAPFVVAEFPSNERVLEISTYLSRFLLIATTAGSRMAIIDADGTLTYGPLLRTPFLNGKFSTFDRFAWSSVTDAGEGRSGLIRFDLSEVSQETRVAWATDLRISATGGTVVGQEILGQDYAAILSVDDVEDGQVARLFLSTPNSPTEDYGIIQTGAMRLGSTVPKNWSRLNLSANPAMIGAIEAKVITNEVIATVGTMSNPTYEIEWKMADESLSSQIAAVQLKLFKGELGETEVVPEPEPTPTPTPGPEPGVGEQSWGSILSYQWGQIGTFWVRWDDLGGGATTVLPGPVAPTPTPNPVVPIPPSATPILESWAIRAVPAIERTELVRLPLLAFDEESDTRGQRLGGKGTALARYKALRDRVGQGRAVPLVNLNTQEEDLVVVDEMSFRQTGKESRGSVFGGVIDIVARVL